MIIILRTPRPPARAHPLNSRGFAALSVRMGRLAGGRGERESGREGGRERGEIPKLSRDPTPLGMVRLCASSCLQVINAAPAAAVGVAPFLPPSVPPSLRTCRQRSASRRRIFKGPKFNSLTETETGDEAAVQAVAILLIGGNERQ